jgi:hypothetical protein
MNTIDTTVHPKAFEEAASRVIFKNPNGFGFNTEGLEIARTLSSQIAGKTSLSPSLKFILQIN